MIMLQKLVNYPLLIHMCKALCLITGIWDLKTGMSWLIQKRLAVSDSLNQIATAFANVSLEQATRPSRVLHGTEVIEWNDPEFLSALHKMNASPGILVEMSMLVPQRSYIYVRQNEWEWKKPAKSVELYIKSKIPSNFQHAFLLMTLEEVEMVGYMAGFDKHWSSICSKVLQW